MSGASYHQMLTSVSPIFRTDGLFNDLTMPSETQDDSIGHLVTLLTLRKQKYAHYINSGSDDMPMKEWKAFWEEMKTLDTEALIILRPLSITSPESYRASLANCLLNLIVDYVNVGLRRADETQDFATETAQLHQTLYTHDPLKYLHMITSSFFIIAECLDWDVTLKIYPEAKDTFILKAVDVARESYALDPLAHGPPLLEFLRSLGNLLLEGLDLKPEARDVYAEAVEVARKLCELDTTTTHTHKLIDLLRYFGDVLRWGFKLYPEARSAYLEMAEVARKLRDVDFVAYGPQLISTLKSFGDFLQHGPELYLEAQQVYSEAVEIACKLYTVDHITHGPQLVETYRYLGDFLREGPRSLSEARFAYYEAVQIAWKLYDVDPIAHGYELIESLMALGFCRYESGAEHYVECQDAYSQAVAVARNLYNMAPIEHGPKLMSTLKTLTWILRDCLQLHAEARDTYVQQVNIAQELYHLNPVANGSILITSLQSFASFMNRTLQSYLEARDMYQEAVEIARNLYNADVVAHGPRLIYSLTRLCDAYVVAGDRAEAKGAAHEAVEILKRHRAHKPILNQDLVEAFLSLRQFLDKLEYHDMLLEVDQEAATVLDRSQIVKRSRGGKIGSGGYGTVFVAQMKQDDPLWRGFKMSTESFVVKIFTQGTSLRPNDTPLLDLSNISSVSRALRRELVISFRLGAITHSNIVRYFGYIVENGNIGLVSEYFTGGDVSKYLHSRSPSDPARVAFCRDIAHGLHHLHTQREPIVHGDLKPSNVVVHKDGHAALCDFGLSRLRIMTNDSTPYTSRSQIARAPQSSGLTTSNFGGTLRYCAPELFDTDDAMPTLESDVYAFGCTAAEILTGNLPFAQYNGAKAESQIMDALDDQCPPYDIQSIIADHPAFSIIAECWAAKPSERPTMAEVCKRMGW